MDKEREKPALKRSEQKLQDILYAAEQVFIEYGYHQASMDKIAEVAHVTKRTIYNKFENKEALFDHIVREMIDGMYAKTNIEFDNTLPLKPQLEFMIGSIWDTMSDEKHIKLKRVVIAEYIRIPDFLSSILDELPQRDEGLSQWLQGAMDSGQLDGDKYLIFEFIVGMIERFSETPLLFDREVPQGDAKETIISEIADLIILKYG